MNDVEVPPHVRGFRRTAVGAPRSPVKKRIARSKLLRPLVWYCVTKRGKQIKEEGHGEGSDNDDTNDVEDTDDDDAASPMDMTRMSDEEELSSLGGYHHFLGLSTDEPSLHAVQDSKEITKDESDDIVKNGSPARKTRNVRIHLGWGRVRRSLRRMIVARNSNGDRQPLSSFDGASSSYDNNLAGLAFPQDDDSTIFSTSTDRKIMDAARRLSTLEIAEQVECCLKQNTLSTDAEEKGKRTSSSLSKYMEKQAMIHLAEVSTQDHDAKSVGSGSLAVSFDEDYPQLFLQPSNNTMTEETDDDDRKDDEGENDAEEMEAHVSFLQQQHAANNGSQSCVYGAQTTEPAAHRLGASYSHPARPRAILSSSFFWKQHQERQRQRNSKACVRSCFDEEQVWDRIDASSRDLALDDPLANAQAKNNLEELPSPVPVRTQLADWDNTGHNEEMRWSFSNEDSDVSFTSLLGNRFFKPVSCRFEQLPAPALCSGDKATLEPFAHEHPYDEFD